MDGLFNIDIFTPAMPAYQGKAVSLIVPSELGYLGILAHHAPLAARLKKGRIIIRDASSKTVVLNTSGNGFIEVLQNNVTIILETALSQPEYQPVSAS